jgi:multidrug efflux pump subunit AcrA (membrane-fusion protein)
MKRIFLWIVISLVCLGIILGAAYTLGYLPLPMATATNATGDEAAALVDPASAEPAGTGQTAVTPIIADAKVVPILSADLSLSSSGIAVDVAVREGSIVTPGQRLVQLETKEALVAIAQAQANLMSAQARFAELQNGALIEEIEAARATVAKPRAPPWQQPRLGSTRLP